jgi:hypothetical protein
MSSDNVTPVQVVPIYDLSNNIKYNFTSNIYKLTNEISDLEYVFNHTGKYEASSSSCLYNINDKGYKNYGPFVAFNNYGENTKNKKDFFVCDMSGSPSNKIASFSYPVYMQNPYDYTTMGPAIYQGGGSSRNTWSTTTNGNNLLGEWIQIKLPENAAIFLYKYTITVPITSNDINSVLGSGTESVSFPKTFTIVGSNDGEKWDLLDNQNIPVEPIGSKSFNVNTSKRYTYFRLIVSELFKNHIGVLAIKQWAIYGTPEPVINKDGFTNLNTLYYYEFNKSNEYSSFKLSSPLLQIEPVQYNSNNNKNILPTKRIDFFLGASLLCLAVGVSIYSLLKK